MKTKDYWLTCFKIFTTMSVLLIVFGVVFTALWSEIIIISPVINN